MINDANYNNQGIADDNLLMVFKVSLSDGTKITNQAGIYFDNNSVVLTSVTLNTLYEYPDPDARFSSKHNCSNYGFAYDFNYTGNTANGSSYSWSFAGGSPATSTLQNPSNIIFSTTGYKEVTLTLNRNGCESIFTDSILVVNEVHSGDSIFVCNGNETAYIPLSSLSAYLENNYCIGACVSSSRLAKTASGKTQFSVTVSPNPTTGECLVGINGLSIDKEIIFIDVFNYSGTRIQSVQLGSNTFENDKTFAIKYFLKLHEITSGIYFVKVKYGEEQKLLKLIIL